MSGALLFLAGLAFAIFEAARENRHWQDRLAKMANEIKERENA